MLRHLTVLAVSALLCAPAMAQVDDFSDGNFTDSPSWTGSQSSYTVLADAPVPNGTVSGRDNYLASLPTAPGRTALVTASAQTSAWKFSLASTNFNPAATNSFGVILMSDQPVSGDVDAADFRGYMLRIGANGSNDSLELWRKDGAAAPVRIGGFPASPNFGTGALRNGLNLRITRSAEGLFEVFYSTGFSFASEPLTSAGTLTDTTHSSSAYFGVYTRFDNPGATRRLYLDNVDLSFSAGPRLKGEPTRHVADFRVTRRTSATLELQWQASEGDTIPDGYLLLGKMRTGRFPFIDDGVAIEDRTEWINDNFAVNIPHSEGTMSYLATGLLSNEQYEFEIYPYTNGGNNINYRLRGPIPFAFGVTSGFVARNGDDFTDGDFLADPTWVGSTAGWNVFADTTVSFGNAATDGAFLGSVNNVVGGNVLMLPTAETKEWRFSWATNRYAPSQTNFTGVVLMSDRTFTGAIESASFNGYFLKLGRAGSDDKIELWKKQGSAPAVEVGIFDTPNFGANGINTGLNIRVVRSAEGDFELFYGTGFTYAETPTQSAGVIRDAQFSSSSYFGVYTQLISNNRQAFFDNVEFGPRIAPELAVIGQFPTFTGTVNTPSVPRGVILNGQFLSAPIRISAGKHFQVRLLGAQSWDSTVVVPVQNGLVLGVVLEVRYAPTENGPHQSTVTFSTFGIPQRTFDVFGMNFESPTEDFTDGELLNNPAWNGSLSSVEVEDAATLPGGAVRTDGAYMATKGNTGSEVILTRSVEKNEWNFSWATPVYNPSSVNNTGVVLMADRAIRGNVEDEQWKGYYLKVGRNGSTDQIELWKKDMADSTYIGSFNTPNFGTGGVPGINVRVTRSNTGVFQLFWSEGFDFFVPPTTSAGTLTDASFDSTAYFGPFQVFANPNPTSRRLFIDNIYLPANAALRGFALVAPQRNAVVEVVGSPSQEFAFSWEPASSVGNPRYKVVVSFPFQINGANSLELDADNAGAATRLTLRQSALDSLLAGLGVNVSGQISLRWRVRVVGTDVASSQEWGIVFRRGVLIYPFDLQEPAAQAVLEVELNDKSSANFSWQPVRTNESVATAARYEWWLKAAEGDAQPLIQYVSNDKGASPAMSLPKTLLHNVALTRLNCGLGRECTAYWTVRARSATADVMAVSSRPVVLVPTVPTSVEEDMLRSAVSVWPNPAASAVSVRLMPHEIGSTAQVVDLAGRVIYSVEATAAILVLDVAGMAEGTYFVRLTGTGGVRTERFSIAR